MTSSSSKFKVKNCVSIFSVRVHCLRAAHSKKNVPPKNGKQTKKSGDQKATPFNQFFNWSKLESKLYPFPVPSKRPS